MTVQKINQLLYKAECLLADNLITQYRFNRIREKLLSFADSHPKYIYDDEYNKLCLRPNDELNAIVRSLKSKKLRPEIPKTNSHTVSDETFLPNPNISSYQQALFKAWKEHNL